MKILWEAETRACTRNRGNPLYQLSVVIPASLSMVEIPPVQLGSARIHTIYRRRSFVKAELPQLDRDIH
jgi:hypothetical protein